MTDPKIVAEILKLEKDRADAIMGVDVAAMDRLFSDDMVYIHSTGTVDTKASYMAKVASGKSKYGSFTFDKVNVRIYGDCAVVSGDVLLQASTLLPLRFTNVWARGGGHWRNVHWVSVKYPLA